MSSTREGLRPSRRTLVRGAVWTLPVVAAVNAAPAFAASTCAPVTIDFTTFTNGQQVPSGSSAAYGGVTVSLTYTGATNAANNATIFQWANSTTKELRFYDLNASSTQQVITLGFSQQVKNLTVTWVDVDYAQNSFDDKLWTTTGGSTATKGSAVTGSGTQASPWASTSQSADGVTSNNVAVTWASATQVSFVYGQGPGTIQGNPHIGIRTITFTPTSC